MPFSPQCLAEIVFFGREYGGRETPPMTGIHPQIKIDDYYTSCKMDSIDGEDTFNFGVHHLVNLTFFVYPELHLPKLYKGFKFNILEGTHCIGNGIILEMY